MKLVRKRIPIKLFIQILSGIVEAENLEIRKFNFLAENIVIMQKVLYMLNCINII